MRILLAILLCLGLLAAGCTAGDDTSDRADTIDDNAADEGADEGADLPDLEPHGQQLTAEQAEDALLSVRDLPTGWVLADDEKEGEPDGEVDVVRPERCARILDPMEGDSAEPAAEADVMFHRGDLAGTRLVQSIDSYEEPLAGDLVTDTTEALEECSEFTMVDDQGKRTRVDASAMSFPKLGDETVALHVALEQDGVELTTTVVIVAVGHNALTLVGGGYGGVPAEQLETIARAAVDKLEATA